MKRTLTTGAATLLAMLALGVTASQAKTLVYCSEGSPENFTPALNTTGTSFDAARPVYNQLVEFERGTTKVVPEFLEKFRRVRFEHRKWDSLLQATSRQDKERVALALVPKMPSHMLYNFVFAFHKKCGANNL
jgi:ABC-type oligopeptide transport system substrate-binding subunit